MNDKLRQAAQAEPDGWVLVRAERHKLSDAPCDRCGYNGRGYYQPETHACAALGGGQMIGMWLVYTDDAGVVETAGVFSSSERATEVAHEYERLSGMKWGLRLLPPIDTAWEI